MLLFLGNNKVRLAKFFPLADHAGRRYGTKWLTPVDQGVFAKVVVKSALLRRGFKSEELMNLCPVFIVIGDFDAPGILGHLHA